MKTLLLLILIFLLIGCTTDTEDPHIEDGEYISIFLETEVHLNVRGENYTLSGYSDGSLIYSESGRFTQTPDKICLWGGDPTDPNPCSPVFDVSQNGFSMRWEDPEMVEATGSTFTRWVRQ